MKKQTLLVLSPVCCAIISVLATSQAMAAANFRIVPQQGTSLPTLVYPGGTTSAYYTITNLTNSTRNGYVIQNLPATAVQNTTGSNCKAVISLASQGQCTLQIDITGAAKTGFALCKGSSCTTAAVPLNVSMASSPQPMIAAGAVTGTFPAMGLLTGGGVSPTQLPLLAHSGNQAALKHAL